VADPILDRVRSFSSGFPGRSLNQARTNHFVIDSSSQGAPEAVSSIESFLAGLSSCGVNLVGGEARAQGIDLQRVEVDIEGVRSADDHSRFEAVSMRFLLTGATKDQAEALVSTYKKR
jgi:uncharacterized OsmC-like protein